MRKGECTHFFRSVEMSRNQARALAELITFQLEALVVPRFPVRLEQTKTPQGGVHLYATIGDDMYHIAKNGNVIGPLAGEGEPLENQVRRAQASARR